jgi:hypothetical protein
LCLLKFTDTHTKHINYSAGILVRWFHAEYLFVGNFLYLWWMWLFFHNRRDFVATMNLCKFSILVLWTCSIANEWFVSHRDNQNLHFLHLTCTKRTIRGTPEQSPQKVRVLMSNQLRIIETTNDTWLDVSQLLSLTRLTKYQRFFSTVWSH